jgi:hypothetical protein
MAKVLSLYGGDVHLEFDDKAHAYFWREKGLPVAGVTSILSVLNKPALVQWAANCAAEYIANAYVAARENGGELEPTAFLSLCQEAKTAHRKLSSEATDIGSAVHAFAEKVLIDRRASLPSDEKAAKGCAAFLDWFHAHKVEPIHVERMVFSRRWYYAGTVDMFGRLDDELCVLDFKSSSGLYLEMILQLAAYSVALEEETGERIDIGWIVRLDKRTGKCQPYRIPLTDREKDAWLRVREAHQMIGKIEEQLDGLRAQRAA